MRRDRYTTPAIVLHWLIAAAILFQMQLPWRFHDLKTPEAFALIQLHKSVGITILVLSLARLGWQIGDHGPILGHHLYQELSPVLQNLGDSPTLRQRISGLATGPSGSRLARAALMADGRKE